MTDIVYNHDASTSPLFLFYSMHLVHMPLQVQEEKLAEFSNINNKYRQLMHAMVNTMDNYVGELVNALKDTGLWDDAIVVLHADNGGKICTVCVTYCYSIFPAYMFA